MEGGGGGRGSDIYWVSSINLRCYFVAALLVVIIFQAIGSIRAELRIAL